MPKNLSPSSAQLTVKSVSFEFPQGDVLFSGISFALGQERYGLVGPNGAGKTTLARLLTGDLEPTRGEIIRGLSSCYLAQQEVPEAGRLVSEYLTELWESPFADPELWGPLLQDISLEQPLDQLSGGQWMRVRIANALSRNAGLLIMDEPTNNLDRAARTLIRNFVDSYRGGLLLISHDRELLNHVDKILEISTQGISIYGGNHAFYQEQRAHEAEVHQSKVDRARREKNRHEREYHEKLASQDKRMREGKKKGDSGSLPRILVGGLKRRAQETRARLHVREEKRAEDSHSEFKELFLKTKQETLLGLTFPETIVPEGKLIFELEDANVSYGNNGPLVWKHGISMSMRGPRRWALAGDNGSGKTTLIKALLGDPVIVAHGVLKLGQVATALLDQNYSSLDPDRNTLENVMDRSRYDIVETRNLLARFQFMGEKTLHPVSSLSGGEKLKASLAQILLASPAPQFLILDEPTNNLDLVSLEVLEGALREYQGALLVVSHDEEFLKNIGVEEVYVLQS